MNHPTTPMHYSEHFIGDPANQMTHWIFQDMPDNCAVAAETSLINQFLADDISLQDANYISVSNGWWQPGVGTNPHDIGNMMDAFGIGNHTVMNASVEQLVAELQQGHGVIVAVNSSELWDQGILNDLDNFFLDVFGKDNEVAADHAVVITGIDMSDPDHPMAILNDSGTPNGAAVRYPLDQFVDAWENSGFYYTATNDPIPESIYGSPASQGFDLAEILGLATAVFTGDPLSGLLVTTGVELLQDADWESILA